MAMIVPGWLSLPEYPFKSHYQEVEGGKIHYIKEGEGKNILWLHDLPLWSFQYRYAIKSLLPDFHCVAPDLLGHGLSDQPEEADYSLQAQGDRLLKLVEVLQIKDSILVSHGYSSDLAIFLLSRKPELFTTMIFMNAYWGGGEGFWGRKQWKARFYKREPMFFRMRLRRGFQKRSSASPWILNHYMNPFFDQKRKNLWNVRAFPGQFSLGTNQLPDFHPEQKVFFIDSSSHPWIPESVLESRKIMYPHSNIFRIANAGYYFEDSSKEELVSTLQHIFAPL